jgi:nucleoside-triphosphatase THEP1
MKIYISGSVGSGKTLLAEMFREKAERAGLSVLVSDHQLHSWRDSFIADQDEAIRSFEESGKAVGIFVVNHGSERHVPVISFSDYVSPDSFFFG